MRTLFDEFFDDLLDVEGGFANDPRDSGGATKYGITEAVARKFGYMDEMKALPLNLARQIYKELYWDALKLDMVQNTCPALCFKLADISVNMGVQKAGTYLQRLLNVLNGMGKLYPDITVDGKVGPATIETLRKYLTRRARDGEIVLIRGLNCLQGEFYISLAETREKDEAFIHGWLLNRIG